jgi:hypothetical protein
VLTLEDILPSAERFVTTYALRTKTPDKKLLAAFSLSPTAEVNPGLLGINMSPGNWGKFYGAPLDRCKDLAQRRPRLTGPRTCAISASTTSTRVPYAPRQGRHPRRTAPLR